MKQYQRKLQIAQQNPYHSITSVVLKDAVDRRYIGVKDVEQIPYQLVEQFVNTERYVHHTYDAHAWGGRAIDIRIMHPITGRFMSGSSSGTAVNVFCELNDLGIGTDGGGSVLAPAMALNLFGFISPLIEQEYLQAYEKISTDQIHFTPSIGFMTRCYNELLDAIEVVLPMQRQTCDDARIVRSIQDDTCYPFLTEGILFPDIYGERRGMLEFLKETLKTCDILISKEGPIDLEGIGDSVFGAYGGICESLQRASKKGLLRVVNMVNATAVCIPDTNLSCGYVLICSSEIEKIQTMLAYAEVLINQRCAVSERYFQNLAMYE